MRRASNEAMDCASASDTGGLHRAGIGELAKHRQSAYLKFAAFKTTRQENIVVDDQRSRSALLRESRGVFRSSKGLKYLSSS